MKALLQRVSQAKVRVDGLLVGEIQAGLLVFIGIDKPDTHAVADKLLDKILHYRIFTDAAGKMNLGLQQTAGGLLLVSQFTLSAQTNKGLRPGFSSAASPEQSADLYNYLVARAQSLHPQVATGRFGADMQVELINDGPVTFWLEG